MTQSSTTLRVAIQMDPMAAIDINGDSTFALALEAQARGHRLWHYLAQDLVFRDGRVTAKAHPLSVRREAGHHFSFGAPETIDLGSDVEVVLMRQDPPFDMAYITATHLLDHIHPKTLVVNDPTEVRNAPEKLFVTRFPELMPPTLITLDRAAIAAFRAEWGDIIVKPLYGNGGAGVFHIAPGDENLNALLEMFAQRSREPVMVQRYLPEIRQGDKRVILIDGKAAGAVNRVPAAGEARSNMHIGGRPEKTPLTARDLEICEAIGPILREKGLLFVGIDVIGDWLTEINVTSPTGIQEIDRFDGVCLEADLWNAIEAKL
ncbi:glutathione synthase [Rhodospirillum rubrum]|uniref:Glutathione synthetase n=1 Tax=Rhodospirillum rubrum (strain ATCC 11170 / ATH 1.1.1 / DSM 467 / LMG 4362 / NCIMB 8255 / S1) TaxID=269796 RepID=Q2RN11_RHORT|nr:glutathione synthase [Rhodospirillum rubrum]ABC24484.1 glutathione synthase [Rhodospirillum rubrum ATCC 11170]AEO50235.1 glutathione synthetase [Rhodospirillum rubrum F11]MBK5956210.1 glutathione synthase [Rhodospirillum rubrum]QXG80402.1 glutathione synthase [Rhodospirillum rubrum]HAQ01473.1 glutathione synthase [Rhodospirillum rubrum]